MSETCLMPNSLADELRSRLLPWESEGDLRLVIEEWREAFNPKGPAEAALVNQLKPPINFQNYEKRRPS